ncbi:MAG: hypothetical protein AAF927_15135 [Bacteroidota bacterium]
MIKESSEARLDQLRDLLFEEELRAQTLLEKDVHTLRKIVLEEEEFADHLSPHFQKNVEYLRDNFPHLFGRYLGEAIKIQIRDSQAEIIDALYPIIGKLINKYLRSEIQRISQQLDSRLSDPFSKKTLKLRWKAFWSGVSYQELLIQQASSAKIQEVFFINKNSGMLLGHHSFNDITHPDMVAGMLKGLQDFVEHALETASEELEILEYDRHTFLLHHLETITVAVVVDGEQNANYRSLLRKHIFDFMELFPVRADEIRNRADQEELAGKIKTHFDGFNQVDQ